MPTKWLPDNANIDHLKNQAKDVLRDFRAGHMAAFQRAREFHPKLSGTSDDEMPAQTFSLSDAQLLIAREYGYASWPRLRAVVAERHHEELQLTHNERLPDGPFKQALDFMDAGEAEHLKQHLARHPGLVCKKASFEGGNYFSNPTLLAFLPENPFRHERMPDNALEIAQILLDAGAKDDPQTLNETLGLAVSGRVCREAGFQVPLIKLLCDHGADLREAMHAALVHLEFDAARALIACGATIDLVVAATLGETEAVAKLVTAASDEARQEALSLSANADRAEIVTMLLKAGADPNRYNPPGGHSHCTPLHSAVASDQYEVVVALVGGSADLSITDIHHNMTALGWAEYMNRDKIVSFLKQHM